MKLGDLKKLLESATDDTEIKVENGEIVIIEPKPIEYKFNVGDKVIYPRLADASEIMTITERLSVNGCPCYNLTTDKNVKLQCLEEDIHPYIPEDITEQIKTFEDAYRWCEDNAEVNLVNQYDDWEIYNDSSKDVIAYLKLRIITAALNEGWEPTFDEDEQRWYVYYHIEDGMPSVGSERLTFDLQKPASLLFKSARLAEYAATQFADIYADFCGYKENDNNN